MRAIRPLPEDVDARIGALGAAWAADPDVAAVWLFGSRARDRAAPLSDVDLAVALAPALDSGARWRKRHTLLADACERLGTDAVDLVVLEDAPSVVGHRALSGGRLLADPDPRRRVEIFETVVRRYLDEAPLRAELDRALAERVREGSFAG